MVDGRRRCGGATGRWSPATGGTSSSSATCWRAAGTRSAEAAGPAHRSGDEARSLTPAGGYALHPLAPSTLVRGAPRADAALDRRPRTAAGIRAARVVALVRRPCSSAAPRTMTRAPRGLRSRAAPARRAPAPMLDPSGRVRLPRLHAHRAAGSLRLGSPRCSPPRPAYSAGAARVALVRNTAWGRPNASRSPRGASRASRARAARRRSRARPARRPRRSPARRTPRRASARRPRSRSRAPTRRRRACSRARPRRSACGTARRRRSACPRRAR